MKHHAKRTNLAFITISGLMLSSQAYSVETPIYKWQDHRGITQYSDRAPTVPYTKASRFEMINAMQAKDLCAVPAAGAALYLPKVNVASKATPEYSANLFAGIGSGINNTLVSAANAVTKARAKAARATKAAKAAAKRAAAAAKAAAVSAGNSSLGGSVAATAAQLAAAQLAAAQLAAAQLAAAQLAAAQLAAAQLAAAQLAAAQAASNTNPNLIQRGLMPAVDITKNITPKLGYSTLRIQDTTELPTINPNPMGGEFRVVCGASHMSNDDPLVYPNQPGAAHHHTFFGNTSINAKSDLNNLASIGNSTCGGGIMNRSGYWAPSMINTTTNTPIEPDFAIFYYKAGGTPGALIKAPPKGLKMIAGNPKGNTSASGMSSYTCIPPNDGIARPFYGWYKSIPACEVGWEMDMSVGFNQCWDGMNLDSPDHQSHMAPASFQAGTANNCPATHPISIPQITLNMRYTVKPGMDLSKWRLASDNYDNSLPGGYSSHADWINGWDEQIMAGIIKNCINIQGDCHAHLLGAGKMFY